jgi:hypothetical protein
LNSLKESALFVLDFGIASKSVSFLEFFLFLLFQELGLYGLLQDASVCWLDFPLLLLITI